jgi:hypothetical protein
MRLWLYSKLLNYMLKRNHNSKVYLKVWELWHIEKRRRDHGDLLHRKGSC